MSTGQFSNLWGATGGQFQLSGITMTVMEAMSRGLLRANVTNEPTNPAIPLLAELSTGLQAHTALSNGNID